MGESTSILKPDDLTVLRLMAEGIVRKQIADAIGASFQTVTYCLRRSRQALDAKTSTEAVAKAIRSGLI